MVALRAVLFDMDGVLVHSHDAWFAVMAAAAEEFGCPPLDRAEFDACFGQGTEEDAERFYGGRSAAEVTAYYEAHFGRHLGAVRADPDAAAAMDDARSRGLSVAVVTNTPPDVARTILDLHGLSADALAAPVPADGLAEKPAPDLVLHACAALGVSPGAALMVGDSRYDRLAAEAAGAPFAGLAGVGGHPLGTVGDLPRLLDSLGARRV